MQDGMPEMKVKLEGRLQGVREGAVVGWAWDRRGPDIAELIDVFVDGELLGRTRAGQLSKNLARRGIGSGQHGFRFSLPSTMLDDQDHVVAARYARSGEDLPGSPLTTVLAPTTGDAGEEERFIGAPPTGKAMALLGKDGWLHLCNTRNMDQLVGRIRLTDRQLADYRSAFCARRDRFRELSIPYVFAPAPMKEIIYREYLPDELPLTTEPLPTDQLLELFRDEPGVDILDLRPHLLEAKRYEQVYYRTDTHCNLVGGYHVYRGLLKEASRFVPQLAPRPIDSFSFVEMRRFRGDLADKEKMTVRGKTITPCDPALNDPALYRERTMGIDPSSLRARELPVSEVPDEYMVSPTRKTLIHENPESPELPRAVVVRDSSMEQVMPYLSEHFSRVVYVWVPNPPFSVIEAEQPDVVLQLMMGRFLIRSPLMPDWELSGEYAVGYEPTAEEVAIG
jgi:alginate O-acetyltransferase complex protein AlgJ